jgi:hypothetical protein
MKWGNEQGNGVAAAIGVSLVHVGEEMRGGGATALHVEEGEEGA